MKIVSPWNEPLESERCPDRKIGSRIWHTPLPITNCRLRLFCFPHAGAGASTYFRWLRAMKAKGIEIVSAQYAGREDRISEPIAESVHRLVDDLFLSFPSMIRNTDYAFFGHSMGGLIAYEAARKLSCCHQIRQPQRIFISAKNPPHIPVRLPPIGNFSDDEFLKEIEHRYGAMPREILQDSEMKRLAIKVLRSDLLMLERYCPESDQTIHVPITVFGGREDHLIDLQDLWQWQQYSSSRIDVHGFKGGHFYLHNNEEDVVQRIVAILSIGQKNR